MGGKGFCLKMPLLSRGASKSFWELRVTNLTFQSAGGVWLSWLHFALWYVSPSSGILSMRIPSTSTWSQSKLLPYYRVAAETHCMADSPWPLHEPCRHFLNFHSDSPYQHVSLGSDWNLGCCCPQCAALTRLIVREGDCVCCEGASWAKTPKTPAIQAPGPVEGVCMSHLLLSCHGKDFQCRSYSGSLDYTWKPLLGEQSISEQEFEITWNGWDPKWQLRGAGEGCGDRWFPLWKSTVRRGICQRVSSSRGRGVGQGCRGVRAKGYAQKPQRAMAAIPQCLEIGSCRPASSIQESSTIMHIPELLALSPEQQGWLSSRKFHLAIL